MDRFKYLGSFVKQACNLKTEITVRIQATSHAFYSLKQRVLDNYDLSTNTKITVFKQCLLPILLYGSETWTLYSQEVKQLRTIQQRHLRSILKIRWFDFVANEEVLAKSDVADIEVLLAQSCLRWLGHVSRMEDNGICKRLLYGDLADGSRPIGRPKLRFKVNCKSILKNGNILHNWNDTGKYRVKWRSIIKLFRKGKYDRVRERRKR